MNLMPRVSVIVPTYNRAHLIDRALESLLAQTYQDFEIIVVDDGSTDHTREVVSRYRDGVTYIFQENAGPAAARNRGIRAATGEYLAFLDSDDLVSPTKLALQMTYLEAHSEFGVVYSGWQTISEDGATVQNEIRPNRQGDLLKDLLLEGYLFPIHSTLVRRDCVERAGLFDESLSAFEDPDLWIRIARAGYKFGCMKQPLCQWRMTSGSLGKDLTKLEQSVPIVLRKVFDDPGLPPQFARLKDEVHARRYLSFGLNYYYLYLSDGAQTRERLDLARQYLLKALGLQPDLLTGRPELLDLVLYKAMELNPHAPDAHVDTVINSLLSEADRHEQLRPQLLGRLHIILAFQAYAADHREQVIRRALEGIRYDWVWLRNRGVLAILAKSLVGRTPPLAIK